MPTRAVHLVLDANDTSSLAAFWASALGWEISSDEPGEAVVWPAGFQYPGKTALPLIFVPVPEGKAGKNRVHLDLATSSRENQVATVQRLLELGASRGDIGQGKVPWEVMADPEGNEFCVLEPRDVYRDTRPVAAVVIDCADPPALARFWAAAAGWPVRESDADFASLRSASDAGPFLEMLRVPDGKRSKNRLHVDVAPAPGGDARTEAVRLIDLGASPADVGQRNVRWIVLGDPEGNEFCVLSPR
jgi:Glyoxalase-like domain